MNLRLVSSNPAFYGMNFDTSSPGECANVSCAKCGRDTCAPYELSDELIWCMYCGIDHGDLWEDHEPGEAKHQYSFGITFTERARQ